MIETKALVAAIRDIDPVVNLAGNTGRTVRRVLERQLIEQPDGSAVARYEVQSDLGGLAFAYLAMEARRAARYATEVAVEARQDGLTFAVVQVDPTALSIAVEARAIVLPEGMGERQELLNVLAAGLDTLCQNLQRAPHTADSIFFQLFGTGSVDDSIRNPRYLAQFDKLVAGDFSEIADTPCVLLDLAADLNPAVAVAEAELDARYAAEDEMTRMLERC